LLTRKSNHRMAPPGLRIRNISAATAASTPDPEST
jgi:hypothetical protein